MMSLHNVSNGRGNASIIHSEWGRLRQSFYEGSSSLRNFSPASSPPDILWSSSGSDGDSSSRAHVLHKVITRLDFNSCVGRSPGVCRQFRARVTRNVVNADEAASQKYNFEKCSESLDNSIPNPNNKDEIKRKDENSIQESGTEFSINQIKDEINQGGVIHHQSSRHNSGAADMSEIMRLSPAMGVEKLSPVLGGRNLSSTFRAKNLSPVIGGNLSPLSEVQNLSPVIKDEYSLTEMEVRNLSPVMGDKKATPSMRVGRLSPVLGERNLSSQDKSCRKLCKRKRRKKLNESCQQEQPAIPVLGLHRNSQEVICHSKKEIEDNTSPSSICLYDSECANEENQLSKSSALSPVLKSRRKLRKLKLSVTALHSEEKQLVGTDVCRETRLKNEDTPTLCPASLSPILGKSSEKKCRKFRRKSSKTQKPSDIANNSGILEESSLCQNVIEITPKQKEVCSGRCSNMECTDVDDEGECFESENADILQKRTSSVRETNSKTSESIVQQCSQLDINNSSVEINEITRPVELVRNSDDVVSNISPASQFVIEEACDAGKEASPDAATLDQLIETETSQDISQGNRDGFTQDSCADRISKISSSSPSSGKLEVGLLISSCSTPESQKVRAVASQNPGNEEVTTLYMDSCKKRRLRLNKSGLAARLKKLLARQHSSTRIWQHETNYFNPLRPNNRGLLLVVNSVWREYSRLMIHCTPSSGKTISPLSSESEESNSNSNNASLGIVVVLDPLLYSHIRPSSTIRVYPPWQQLCVSRLNVTLVLGVSYVEEVNSAQKQWLISGERQPQVSEVLYTCQCSCQKGDNGRNKCQFRFPRNGLEFLEYLLPRKMQVEALHCGTANTEQLSITEEVICQNRRMNTIAEVVAKQSCLQSEEECLQLCILQVFRYKTRSNIKTGDDDTGWSVLGCDATGVCCELVLGSSPPASEMPQWWEGITSKQVLGKFCKFTGFTIKRRIHRTKCPSLWSLIVKNKEVNEKQNLAGRGKRSPACELENEKAASKKHVQEVSGDVHLDKHLRDNISESEVHKNAAQINTSELPGSVNMGGNQLFIYVFSPATELWEMEQLEETPDLNIAASASPQLSSLKQTLTESDSGAHRHSCVVKLLYLTDDCMYVTDPSVCSVAAPGYVIVSVKPSCIIPKQVSSKKVTLVLLQDILADKGSLSADRYSWLEPVSSTVAIHAALSEQDVNLIANVKGSVMDLASSSSVKDLVNVMGTVVGVDEETAFAWPVCGICENDILVELDSNEYLCQECNTSPHTFTKMSLEVFVSCPQFPESRKVKVKLQQESILKLLPLSQDNREGYELSSVLGREVGPLVCVVMRTGTDGFMLKEIPAVC
ncbi:DNA repair-scaffolding protein-like [Periplaneta americana]|uniref:DNA repair-scaffolding protein-like n=1 Tax=Periplaneta americana TaxID=6978 RepID=UPI0037E7CE19